MQDSKLNKGFFSIFRDFKEVSGRYDPEYRAVWCYHNPNPRPVFSTNMLTLFGMILAIGLVVDDAIIVVESVEHSMATLGMNAKEAAVKAIGQLAGKVERSRRAQADLAGRKHVVAADQRGGQCGA